MTKPAASDPTIPPELKAQQDRIKNRAVPLLTSPDALMIDTEKMAVYFSGKRSLDIAPTTVKVPFSAVLTAAAFLMQTVIAPSVQAGEVELAKSQQKKIQ